MASLVRGSKGYLVLQFRWRGKLERIYLGCPDTRDNRRAHAALLRDVSYEVATGTLDMAARWPQRQRREEPAAAPLTTLASYARRWLDGQLQISIGERVAIEGRWRRYLDRTPLGAMEPRDVTRLDIAAALKDKPPIDAKKFLQRLKTLFELLVEDGVVARNPCAHVKPPRPERKEPIEVFSAEEQASIMAVATGQDRAMIAVGMWTGAGPQELCRIERRDVDFERKKLQLRGTKTETRTRVIDLHPRALAALRAWLAMDTRLGPIFTGAKLGRPIQFSNWRRRNWGPILAAAGVAYRTPYAMRHTYAVMMLTEGHDPVYVAKQMGHQDSATLHKHYARWTVKPKATEVGGK